MYYHFSATQTPPAITYTHDIGVQCDLLEPMDTADPRAAILSEPLASSSPCKPDLHPSSESEDEISQTEGDKTFVLSQESQYVILYGYIISLSNHKSFMIRSESDCDMTTKTNKFYLVTDAALLSLFVSCIFCGKAAKISKKIISGTFLKIVQICGSCLKRRVWQSQPVVGTIPLGNISMSAAILFSGSLPSKALQMFEILNVHAIARNTFFRHQEMFLQPAVRSAWKRQQESLLCDLKQKGNPVALAGDGRADSPGHSAKYGTYSLLDLDCQKIIHTQLVTVSFTP